MRKHALILVVGRKGSGKSTITKTLAEKMGLRIVKTYKIGYPALSDEETEFVDSFEGIQNIAAEADGECVTYDDLYRGDFLIATPAMTKELRNNIARKFHIVDFCIYADEKLRKKRSPLDADGFEMVNCNESTAYSDYEKNHEYDILIYNNWAVEKAVDVMESYAKIVMQYRLADLESGVDPDTDYLNWLAEQNPPVQEEVQEAEPQAIPEANAPETSETDSAESSAVADAEEPETAETPEAPEEHEEASSQTEEETSSSEPETEPPVPAETAPAEEEEIPEEPAAVQPTEETPKAENPGAFSLDDDIPDDGEEQENASSVEDEDPGDNAETGSTVSEDGLGMFSLDDDEPSDEEEEFEELPEVDETDEPESDEDDDDDLFSLGDDDDEEDSEEPEEETAEEEPAEEPDPFQGSDNGSGRFDLGEEEQAEENPADVPDEPVAAPPEESEPETDVVDEDDPPAEPAEETAAEAQETVEEAAEEIPEEPKPVSMGLSGPGKDVIERLRAEYPAGTRVELLEMDDVQAPPVGTLGTVKGVDDLGSIMVSWDSGSVLSVVYGVDSVRKVAEAETEMEPEEPAEAMPEAETEVESEADEDDDWFDGDDDYVPVLN